MISVICPCYNSEKYLTQLLDSLYNQTKYFSNFEIIFIDDGSIDNTIQLLEKNQKRFLHKSIQYTIHRQDHKGPGAARNSGIKLAKYRYIAFIDSDDIWYADKLSICSNEMIQTNYSYNVYTHNELFRRKDNDNNKIIKNGLTGDNISKKLYIRNCFSTSAIIIERDLLIDNNYFDERLMSSQDYDMWLKISQKMKVCIIDKVLGEYIENPNGITARSYFIRVLDQLTIAIRYKHYVSYPRFIYKMSKIVFSKQWFYSLINIILNKKEHNY